MSILEQIDDFISGDENYDDETFNKMADFIISIDEKQQDFLTDKQSDLLESIYDDFDFDEDELVEIRLAKRTKVKERMQAKRYYRTHRSAIKRRKKRFKISAAGKRRKKMTARMAKAGKTATGRRKVRYRT